MHFFLNALSAGRHLAVAKCQAVNFPLWRFVFLGRRLQRRKRCAGLDGLQALKLAFEAGEITPGQLSALRELHG